MGDGEAVTTPTGIARSQAQCAPSCARYRSPLSPENVEGLDRPFCAAFPGGIPQEIWTNQFDHRQPHESDHGLQWVAREGYGFPVSAFGEGILDGVGEGETLTAAADVLDGAMVALVPSAEHAARLAVDGGEPMDQLHCTLVYLGKAAELDEMTTATLRAWAEGMGNGQAGWSSIEANGFAAAIFNPDGEDRCSVIVCSGADLAEFFETVRADVADLVHLPDDEHVPWIPHITLAYPSESGGHVSLPVALDRVGPVVFDRLRLAIGGDVLDVPLAASWTPESTSAPESDATAAEVSAPSPIGQISTDSAAVASTQPEREVFDGCLRCFGPTHDGDCPPAL